MSGQAIAKLCRGGTVISSPRAFKTRSSLRLHPNVHARPHTASDPTLRFLASVASSPPLTSQDVRRRHPLGKPEAYERSLAGAVVLAYKTLTESQPI